MGGEHVPLPLPPEPAHLLEHLPGQMFSMNRDANAGGNSVAAFRSSHHGAVPAPLNSLDFSVQRASGAASALGSTMVVPKGSFAPPQAPQQIDGGQVVHPIYLTTERVTFTAPRNKVDTSYDSRDGYHHTRRSISPQALHQAGGITSVRDSFLSQNDIYRSDRSASAMYATDRSVGHQASAQDMSYTDQLNRSLDPVHNMLHSAQQYGRDAKLIPPERQYVTEDVRALDYFQNYVQETVAGIDAREMEIERLKRLTTEQARQMAEQRNFVAALQSAQQRSQEQHSELCSRFQALMQDNETLLMHVKESPPGARLPGPPDVDMYPPPQPPEFAYMGLDIGRNVPNSLMGGARPRMMPLGIMDSPLSIISSYDPRSSFDPRSSLDPRSSFDPGPSASMAPYDAARSRSLQSMQPPLPPERSMESALAPSNSIDPGYPNLLLDMQTQLQHQLDTALEVAGKERAMANMLQSELSRSKASGSGGGAEDQRRLVTHVLEA
eukprot:Tamp_13434.p1 GENE.Tamp_13434~~Tamp_13434.p1  ORF type:complete len:538 (-),score=47.18 Tamp_13434:107-1591(-)